MSSSDDDDVPLSQLMKQRSKEAGDKKSNGGMSSDDEVPLDQLVANKRQNTPGTAALEPASSGEDSDDVPLAVLYKRSGKTGTKRKRDGKQAKKSGTTSKKARKSAESRSKAAKGKTKATSKSKASKSRGKASRSRGSSKASTGSGGGKSNKDLSLKDAAIASVLRRWKYCMEWPPGGALGDDDLTPPSSDWVAMPGFPGVFVGVLNDATGQVLDRRPKSGRPCYNELAKQSCEELKELWIQGIEKQILELQEHEGEGTRLEGELKRELAQAKKVFG